MMCPKCFYKWEYNGQLRRVTCPNCGHQWFREAMKSDTDE